MLVLGIDFETQDADAKTTRITEVGAVLYQYHPGTKDEQFRKVAVVSEFCYEEDYPPQSEQIVELTGITDEMLKTQGRPRKEVLERDLLRIFGKADIVVAHKTAFDKTVLDSTCKLFGIELPEKEWLCTLSNFPWPKKFTCHKLSHLAYDHSILVDPATLHRAVNDVDLMMRLISKYDFDEILAYARAPWVYLKADILGPWAGKGGDNGVQKAIATSLGFAYEKCKGTDSPSWPKTWVARVKAGQVEHILETVRNSKSPFRVSEIQGIN